MYMFQIMFDWPEMFIMQVSITRVISDVTVPTPSDARHVSEWGRVARAPVSRHPLCSIPALPAFPALPQYIPHPCFPTQIPYFLYQYPLIITV